MLDSTIVRAHAQAAGGRKEAASAMSPWPLPGRADDQNPRLGRRLGQPAALAAGPWSGGRLRPGRRAVAAATGAGYVLTDKGYDTDQTVADVEALRVGVVIPSKKNRLAQRGIDRNLYRDRNKIERFFSLPKQFRRLATRYDQTASSFLRMLHFVSALLWLL